MNNFKDRITSVLSHVLAFSLGVLLVLVIGVVQLHHPDSKLTQLENLILDCFIGETDAKALEDAAASAMVKALDDRWSYYLSAESYQTHMETMDNAYVGIGITILAAEDGSGYSIQSVTEGGPAQAAGLLPGDLMIGVDGQDVRSMDTDTLRSLVRGKEGTSVTVTVVRDGQEQSFLVARQRFETAVATGQLLDNNVGLVTIVNFDSRCAEETITAIETLLGQGARKLIFDVRGNPGGYAHELVKVLDYLLPEGEVFHMLRYDGYESRDQSDAEYLDVPMAVLVDENSYSAAEFFAAALQEYEAAVVVGTQTCGKGYFQQTYEFDDGSAIGLSVGKYFTPQGKNLEGIGVTPDLPVELSEEEALEFAYGRLTPENDPQVQAAANALPG